MIEDELRAAGVDVAAMRADAREAVESATPDGWESVMIRSPWPESRCPFCLVRIAVDTMGVAALTHRLERARVLLFMLVIVCDECVGNELRLDALAARSFE